MGDRIPLFPLPAVLFPGTPMPLHVFEARYRLLVEELVDGEGPRRFGIVAVRSGPQDSGGGVVGGGGALHEVGCVAQLRTVHRYDDGRYDVVTSGGPRFRLHGVDDSRPYLQGDVSYLDEPVGAAGESLAVAVQAALREYLGVLAGSRETSDTNQIELPDDPSELAYAVAASLSLDVAEKQALLECTDTATRLRRELTLLRRESALVARTGRPLGTLREPSPYSLS